MVTIWSTRLSTKYAVKKKTNNCSTTCISFAYFISWLVYKEAKKLCIWELETTTEIGWVEWGRKKKGKENGKAWSLIYYFVYNTNGEYVDEIIIK